MKECIDLLEESQKSVLFDTEVRKPRQDNTSAIYSIIKDLCNYSTGKSVDMSVIEERIYRKGYSEEELQITLKNYENLNVLMIEGNVVSLVE